MFQPSTIRASLCLAVLAAATSSARAAAPFSAGTNATASAGLEEHWEYYPNGVQRVHGWLDGQRREGRWTFWLDSGEVERVLDYQGGVVIHTAATTEPTAAGLPKRPEDATITSAVNASLGWLVQNQQSDGRWSASKSTQKCPSAFDKRIKQSENFDLGLSGLATHALIRARGSDATVTGLDYAAKKGVTWLVSVQKPDGSLLEQHPFMYNQAIATRALVAAWSSSHDDRVRAAAQRAVEFLERAQRPSSRGGMGGWRYSSRQEAEQSARGTEDKKLVDREVFDADTSVTGWCVEALYAAREAGLTVDEDALQGAASFVASCSADNGLVGYLDARTAGATVQGADDQYVYHPATLSAIGMLVRLDTGTKADDGLLHLQAQRVLADQPQVSEDGLSVDYYYWHHGVAALRRLAPAGAQPWENSAVAHLLELQDKGTSDCTKGAWVVRDRWAHSGGALYSTALNTLTLEDELGWK
jgi:hypothetical protein